MSNGTIVIGRLRSILKPSESKVWAQVVPNPKFAASK
jgi:hypothetical protein